MLALPCSPPPPPLPLSRSPSSLPLPLSLADPVAARPVEATAGPGDGRHGRPAVTAGGYGAVRRGAPAPPWSDDSSARSSSDDGEGAATRRVRGPALLEGSRSTRSCARSSGACAMTQPCEVRQSLNTGAGRCRRGCAVPPQMDHDRRCWQFCRASRDTGRVPKRMHGRLVAAAGVRRCSGYGASSRPASPSKAVPLSTMQGQRCSMKPPRLVMVGHSSMVMGTLLA